MPCPSLTDGGWTVNGGGGVASKAAFNLLGGYVEYDIDLSNVDNGVNANIYTISPASFSGSYFNKTLDYCDGAATGSDWCMELDWIEANGHCGGASTIHTIEETFCLNVATELSHQSLFCRIESRRHNC